MRKRAGFTIIEMLIVMAVIAILIAIAVPSFRAIQTQAWRAQCQGDTKTIKIALETYYMKRASFPSATPLGQYQTDLLNEVPPVIEKNLYDPFGATATTMYRYVLSNNGKYYLVYSVAESGTGAATISNAGIISVTAGDPIYASNGRM
jgi:prepilin-type N-terminal cleavage/methylation domain-containing protein